MNKKTYFANYKDKKYHIIAFCEEEVYWKVLSKNGIKIPNVDKIFDLVSREKMEIHLT